ncbi:hypothetical protein QWY90_00010 [Flavobacterium paronense]|uniref:hypothetical protein n=1 Tax=Flavobacterium paronense TaxID=1392775 RepID=UPI0025B5C8B1|nr:hypothetical protein [Flavobacterium paronense]MDN3675755.1 hypothetical protein [Flavobacterium paronense]
MNTNSQSHAHTNEFGAFSIDKTSKGDLLKVSALGFKKTDYKFESNEFTIILEEDIYKLDQVVIQPK